MRLGSNRMFCAGAPGKTCNCRHDMPTCGQDEVSIGKSASGNCRSAMTQHRHGNTVLASSIQKMVFYKININSSTVETCHLLFRSYKKVKVLSQVIYWRTDNKAHWKTWFSKYVFTSPSDQCAVQKEGRWDNASDMCYSPYFIAIK